MKQGKGKNNATYSRVLLRSWKNVSNNFIINVLDRLYLIGDGASKAGRKRDWATQLEGEAARRRQAQEVSRRQLRGSVASYNSNVTSWRYVFLWLILSLTWCYYFDFDAQVTITNACLISEKFNFQKWCLNYWWYLNFAGNILELPMCLKGCLF